MTRQLFRTDRADLRPTDYIIQMLVALATQISAWTVPGCHQQRLRSREAAVSMLAQARLGRLRFGAAKGPKTHEPERDGPWRPGYWVEIDGGRDDGAVVLIPDRSRIADGLAENDMCAVEYDEDGARAVLVASGFRYESEPSLAERVLESAVRPIGIALAILAASVVLVHYAPQPTAREQAERCARLVSAGIEAGDRQSAQRWLASCRLPDIEAAQLLEERWTTRWGAQGPPRLVQGLPER